MVVPVHLLNEYIRMQESRMPNRCRLFRDGVEVFNDICRYSSVDVGGSMAADVTDAQTNEMQTFEITMPIARLNAIRRADIITVDGTDLSLYTSTKQRRSDGAATRIMATEQIVATPYIQVVFSRKVGGTWTDRPPQTVQVVQASTQPAQASQENATAISYEGTIVGPVSLDVMVDDRFMLDGFWCWITNISRSGGRTEAAYRQNRG